MGGVERRLVDEVVAQDLGGEGVEQLLVGVGECGKVTPLAPEDATCVKVGIVHCFRDTSDIEPMKILCVYSFAYVTRTFAYAGITVEHLSAADQVSKEDDK